MQNSNGRSGIGQETARDQRAEEGDGAASQGDGEREGRRSTVKLPRRPEHRRRFARQRQAGKWCFRHRSARRRESSEEQVEARKESQRRGRWGRGWGRMRGRLSPKRMLQHGPRSKKGARTLSAWWFDCLWTDQTSALGAPPPWTVPWSPSGQEMSMTRWPRGAGPELLARCDLERSWAGDREAAIAGLCASSRPGVRSRCKSSRLACAVAARTPRPGPRVEARGLQPGGSDWSNAGRPA